MTTTLNLTTVRREAPDWTWRAERMGRNWQYIGIHVPGEGREVRIVTVASVGVVTGEDEYGVQWRVSEPGRPTVSWAAWLLSERPPEVEAPDPILALAAQMDPAEVARIPTDLAANVDTYVYGGRDDDT